VKTLASLMLAGALVFSFTQSGYAQMSPPAAPAAPVAPKAPAMPKAMSADERLAMAMNQAAVVEAKSHAMATPRDGDAKWFEVATPDGRVIRHRAASLGALRGALLKGYTVTAEVFGASATGIGGVAAHIGSDVPTIMGALLAAHGKELETWLTSHGIKSAAA
jgi:hypothetical protein